MATSTEKLAQLRDEFLTTPPSPDADMGELAFRSALRAGIPMVERMVPEDPSDLDELLERGARMLLELRSDDAPIALAVAVVDEPQPAPLPAGPDA